MRLLKNLEFSTFFSGAMTFSRKDTWQSDTEQNDSQNNFTILHAIVFIGLLSVILMKNDLLRVVLPSVFMRNVVAPFFGFPLRKTVIA